MTDNDLTIAVIIILLVGAIGSGLFVAFVL